MLSKLKDCFFGKREKRMPVKVDPMPIGMPVVKTEVVDGKIQRRVEFVIDDNHKNSHLRVSDFALEALIATGAVKKGDKPNVPSVGGSSLQSADSASRVVNNFVQHVHEIKQNAKQVVESSKTE